MNKKRLFEKMCKEHLDYLVLSSQENVSYTSGMGIPVPYGAMFAYGGGMPLAYTIISLQDQTTTLIISDLFSDSAKAASADQVCSFRHYDHFIDVNGASELEAALRCVLPSDGKGLVMGIEHTSCPVLVYKVLSQIGFAFSEADTVLRYARKVKTPEELEKIKRSVYIEDCGQKRLLEYARNFNNETDFEMWSGITEAMNRAAGKVVRISGELAVGLNNEIRTGLGGPSGLCCRAGDMGRMDISIRYHGYWCDCTNTVTFGKKPNEKQMRYFDVVQEAYEAAKSELIPGKRLSDAAAAEAAVYKKYGMEQQVYTGHQIGCGVNEPGRIVCYEHEEIVPDMVVCIEPQQYGEPGSGIGVRLEKVIAIHEKGPVELNQFNWGMDIWD